MKCAFDYKVNLKVNKFSNLCMYEIKYYILFDIYSLFIGWLSKLESYNPLNILL